jgi:hypothetical protein
MDPAPSDGILTGSAREGVTERLPPPPDVDAGPDIRRCPLRRHLLVLLALAVTHALVSWPVLVASVNLDAFGHTWLGGPLFVAFFFPVFLLEMASVTLPFATPLAAMLGNSLVWSATVYGLFLAGRWARTRLTRPSQIG